MPDSPELTIRTIYLIHNNKKHLMKVQDCLTELLDRPAGELREPDRPLEQVTPEIPQPIIRYRILLLCVIGAQ